MVALLYARAHEDPPATRRGHWRSHWQSSKVLTYLFDDGLPRKRTPAAGRDPPPQASVRAPAWLVAREPLVLLAALRLGDLCEAHDHNRRDRTTADLANSHHVQPWCAQLYRPGTHAGQR